MGKESHVKMGTLQPLHSGLRAPRPPAARPIHLHTANMVYSVSPSLPPLGLGRRRTRCLGSVPTHKVFGAWGYTGHTGPGCYLALAALSP